MTFPGTTGTGWTGTGSAEASAGASGAAASSAAVGFGPAPDMTGPPPAEPLPYHRLARVSGHHRWWRPLVGTVAVLTAYLFLVCVFFFVTWAVGKATGRPEGPDDLPTFGDIGDLAVELATLGIVIPAVLLAVRWVQRRPPGTVSSVAGRLRWRWLGVCLLVALPLTVALTGAGLLLPADAGSSEVIGGDVWAGWPAFLGGLVVIVALVPFQAAAEEYAFRGWLLQVVGGFLRSPWFAIVPQAVLFAAAHGWGTPWGFADLCVFGLLAGWLTVRTGGLEASIGLHVMNNVLSFGISAAFVGGLASDETAADLPWQLAGIDMVMIAGYTLLVLWLARRRGLATTAAPTPYPASPSAPVGPAPDHGWGRGPSPVRPAQQWPAEPVRRQPSSGGRFKPE